MEKHTFNWDPPRPKPLFPHVQHPGVICADNWYDIHARLHRQMKRPLLKRAQHRPLSITPRALGENEHALPLPLHLPRRALKRLDRARPVPTINKHRPRQRHEPAQKRRPRQRRLGRDAAVLWENGREQQHVELGLVVTDQHAGARAEVLAALDDVAGDAGCEGHGVVEGAGGGPLRDAVVAEEAEGEGGEDAVEGAEDEGAVGGEEAGVEGGDADAEGGEGEEGGC